MARESNYVTTAQVRTALQEVYRSDPEANVQLALLRSLEDDRQPMSQKGGWRPRPLLLLAILVPVSAVVIFCFFTFGVGR